MKQYTVRFAHLEKLPELHIRHLVLPNEVVGRMGSSGKSTANHLHIDLIHGFLNRLARLKQIGYETEHVYKPNIEQLNRFIARKLFQFFIVITTPFYDPQYKIDWKKDHPGYDVVPMDRKETKDHFDIHWPIQETGIVLDKGYDNGYGYYILMGYEA